MKKTRKKLLPCLMVAALVFSTLAPFMPMTAYAAELISSADAIITKPVGGETADFSLSSSDPSKYTVEFSTSAIYLYEDPYTNVESGDSYVTGKRYAFRVHFYAKDGYKFDDSTTFTINGETTSSWGGTGQREIIYTASDPSVTTKYIVTLDPNNGTTQGDYVEVVSGGEVGLSAPGAFGFTTPAGKEFDGWLVNGVKYYAGKHFVVTSNVTAIAQWKDISVTTHTVKFNTNGGSAVPDQTVNDGETATRPTNPTRAGWKFMNWYLNPDENTVYGDWYNFGTAVNGDITLEALWDGSVTVTPNGPGMGQLAIGRPGETLSYSETTGISMTVWTPYRDKVKIGAKANDGYKFVKWTLNGEDYSTFAVMDNVTATSSNMTLVAVFEEDSSLPINYSLTVHDKDITDNIEEGYNSDDYVKFISLKNTSNTTLDTSRMEVTFDNDNITIADFKNSTTLNVGDTFNNILYIKPKAGLAKGNYATVVTIKYDTDNDGTHETTLGSGNVTFEVKEGVIIDIKYTVTVDPNNGTTEKRYLDNLTSGTEVGLGAPDTYGFTIPAGKEFDGWLVNGVKYGAGVNFVVTSHTVAVAQWKDAFVLKITEGADQTYVIDSDVDIVIKANGDLSKIVSIKIDGSVLDATNYTVASGSTVLTLKSAYLNTLAVGMHNIEFVYDDGSVATTLKVAKNDGGNTGGDTTDGTGPEDENENNNSTSDNTTTITDDSDNPRTSDDIMFSVITLTLSIIGMAGGVTYINRKKLFNK